MIWKNFNIGKVWIVFVNKSYKLIFQFIPILTLSATQKPNDKSK